MMYENDGGKIMPMLEVEQLFEHKYDLEIQDTFEVTQFIEETRAEFAFDAAVVDDPDAVLDDIHKIVENFNEPPDDLPPEGRRTGGRNRCYQRRATRRRVESGGVDRATSLFFVPSRSISAFAPILYSDAQIRLLIIISSMS